MGPALSLTEFLLIHIESQRILTNWLNNQPKGGMFDCLTDLLVDGWQFNYWLTNRINELSYLIGSLTGKCCWLNEWFDDRMSCWVASWFCGWLVISWVTKWGLSKEMKRKEGNKEVRVRKPSLFCSSLQRQEVMLLSMECEGWLWVVLIWKLIIV
jgi:hypothetical protein